MSSSVSQIPYWLGTSTSSKNKSAEGGEGGSYLSYDTFMGLSVLGGYLGLDHLYLRSPLTFLAKLIVNIMFFGVWWLYDASQALFNRDVVKVFGLGVPVLGPKGIAAGVLAQEVPDKKHMRFFYYALAVTFGGLFGVDSFLVGQNMHGIIRIVSLITIIFAPIALFWWLYKLFKFFFDTKSVITSNYQFFGAPSPQSLSNALSGKFQDFIGSTFGEVADVVIKPFTNTAQAAIQTADDAIITVKDTIALGRNALDKTATVAEEVAGTASQIFSLAPKMGELTASITPESVASAKRDLLQGSQGLIQGGQGLIQSGGNMGSTSGNMLGYTLLGTMGLIAASGFTATYYRSKQSAKNVPRKYNDTPPEPGVL